MRPVRRALSLIEVVVASAVLGILTLATASLMITLQRGAAQTAASVDMVQRARRVLQELRRELRQSGHLVRIETALEEGTINGEPQFEIVNGTNDTLTFRMRTSLPDATGDTEANWARRVTYTTSASDTLRAPGGGTVQRYALVKTVEVLDDSGGWTPLSEGLVVAEGIGSFRVTAIPGASSDPGAQDAEELEVTLQVLRANPDHSDGVPAPLELTLTERMRVYNRPQLPSE